MQRSRKTLYAVVLAAFAVLWLSCMKPTAVFAASSRTKNVIASAQTVYGGKWVKDARGLKYQRPGGTFARSCWIQTGGNVYCIGADQYVRTGWFWYDGRLYCADIHGRIYYDRWLAAPGGKYYFRSNGQRVAGTWEKVNGFYYYFYKTGLLATDTTVDGYYVNSYGVRVVGAWQKIKGKYYYFYASGTMARSALLGRYYVGPDGARVRNQWVLTNGKRYYFGSDGKYLVKWNQLGGKYYFFGVDGKLFTNTWVGMYYVGPDGARLTNTYKDGYWLNEEGLRTKLNFEADYIFFGDSRVVQMGYFVSQDEAAFIAQGGAKYDWMSQTGYPLLRRYLLRKPEIKVILEFGINDLSDTGKYIRFYKNLRKLFPQTKFYVLSVNPIRYELLTGDFRRTITVSGIRNFNKEMAKAFPDSYINTYPYLMASGFRTYDGIHYDGTTYRKLYRYILGALR